MLALALTVARAMNPPGAPHDHYLAYKTTITKHTPKFSPRPFVRLTDAFEDERFDVTAFGDLLVPAEKNGGAIVDQATQLEAYKVKPSKICSISRVSCQKTAECPASEKCRRPKHVVRKGVGVQNQFGTVILDTVRPDTLLVPTSKSLSGSPDPPDPTTHHVDHFKCYLAKLPKGAARFSPLHVSVADQFTSPAKAFDLVKPRHLCLPVDKAGEGIRNPAGILLCYQAKVAKGQPKHKKRTGVEINNQFGPLTVDTIRETELCVPGVSTVIPAPTPSQTPVPTASTTPAATSSATPSPTPNVPPPHISDFDPKAGPVGTLVTITGDNFAPDSGLAPQVSINRRGGGTIVAPIASFDNATIRVTVPTGADTGPLAVTVANQSDTSSAVFTVEPSSTFALSASPTLPSVIVGQSVAVSLSLSSSNGFAQLASLSASGLPPGLTAALKPGLVAAGQKALLTITAAADQPLGQVNIQVSAAAQVDGMDVSAAADVSLTVNPITTTFMGRTVVADDLEQPLAGVTVTMLGRDASGNSTGCSGQTTSDAAGNFVLANLPPQCAGEQMVRYDGLTANDPPGRYAGVDLRYMLVADQVTSSPVLVHLPRIDDKETVLVRQNAASDQTFAFKTIPGLSITVYAGTTFTLVDGAQPDPFSLTAVQVAIDRLPDSKPFNPNMMMVFIVAFQPANATANQPVAVTFPNSINTPPDVNMVLMTLDPTKGQMVPYGTATVSSDGSVVIPDLDPAYPGHRFGLVHFDWHGQMPPPGPTVNPAPPGNGSCPRGSKPIDPASGIEVLNETDLAIAGGRGGLIVERTYRTLSDEPGPFGIGTSHNFGYRLDTNSPQSRAVVNLIMPDGNRFPFITGVSAALVNTTVPVLQEVSLSVMPDGRADLRSKDGTVFHFVPSTFLLGSVLDSIADANGNQTTLVRDPTRPVRISQIVDPVGRKLRLTYDDADRIVTVTDPIGRIVAYTYNAVGRLETVTNPAGGVWRYAYDEQNRLWKVIDPRGITVAENSYYEGDALPGRAKEQLLAGGGRWTFEYILVNPLAPTSPVRQTTVTDPVGAKTVYRYNPQGFLLDVTDAFGQTRIFERENGTNQLLRVRGSASCGACGGLGPGDQSFTYDDRGNMTSTTNAVGNTTSFTYDPTFDKIASITDPFGHQTRFSYGPGGNLLSSIDANQHITSFAYDARGHVTAITDPLSHQTRIGYDAFGNPATIEDALGNRTLLVYDGASRLTEMTDALGRTAQVLYDALDRVTDVIDPQGHTIRAAYDPIGELVSLTDARGNTTSFTYDPVARENTRIDSLGKTDYRRFNVAGNLVEFVDRRGLASQFSYDALNRLIGETYSGAVVQRIYDVLGLLAYVTDTQGGDFSFASDAVGHQVTAAGPSGMITYVRDELGRVKQRQVVGQSAVTYEYDPVGNLIVAASPEAAVAITVDERNQLTTEERSNGVTSSYSYDAVGHVLRIRHTHGSQVIDDQLYSYDATGNRTSRTSIIARPLVTEPSVRLLDTKSDRLIRRDAITYAYDANGNRSSESDPLGTKTYTWDSRNRLRSIQEPDGSSTDLVYDFAGNLISKTVAGPLQVETETYVLDDLTNIALQVSSGSEQLSMLSGRLVDQQLAVSRSADNAAFSLADAVHSTVGVADGSGTLVTRIVYEPYGDKTLLGDGYPFYFTGRTAVAPALYHYRRRYYDPIVGVFLSEDPLSVSAGDANLYRYVRNNPARWRDPTGQQLFWERVRETFCIAVGALPYGEIAGVGCSVLNGTGSDLESILHTFEVLWRWRNVPIQDQLMQPYLPQSPQVPDPPPAHDPDPAPGTGSAGPVGPFGPFAPAPLGPFAPLRDPCP